MNEFALQEAFQNIANYIKTRKAKMDQVDSHLNKIDQKIVEVNEMIQNYIDISVVSDTLDIQINK